MTFKDLLSTFGLNDPKTIWGWLIFLSTIGIEIIPQIKFKPWSALLRWIGNNLNNKLNNIFIDRIHFTIKERQINYGGI